MRIKDPEGYRKPEDILSKTRTSQVIPYSTFVNTRVSPD
jgi:hypothetical protein